MRLVRLVAATACVFALLPPASSSAATRHVDIPGRYFTPQRVTITPGSTVRWTNSSNQRHSITSFSTSDDQFTSSNNCPGSFLGFNDCVRSGGSYEHTFPSSGTFDYYCKIHGTDSRYPNCGMCGRVVVRKKSSVVSPTTPGSVSPSAAASATSPTPSISGSALTSPSATTPIASGPSKDDDSRTLLTIVALAVALLGGTGVVVYRTMIRR